MLRHLRFRRHHRLIRYGDGGFVCFDGGRRLDADLRRCGQGLCFGRNGSLALRLGRSTGSGFSGRFLMLRCARLRGREFELVEVARLGATTF